MLTGTTDPEAVTLATGFDPGKLITFTRGEKIFELSNQLGNSLSRTCGILVTISDRKILVKTGSGSESNGGCDAGTAAEELTLTERGTATSMVAKNRIRLLPGFSSGSGDSFTAYIDNSRPGCELADNPTANPDQFYYIADVISASDYYPFGSTMPGRKYNATTSGYRYGFNGKEDDKEIEEQQDYGFRIYDKQLGRFKSVDPLTAKYPMLTPYQFASNIPTAGIDLDGLELYFSTSGKFIGKFGKDLLIRVVTDDKVEKQIKDDVKKKLNVAAKEFSSYKMSNNELNEIIRQHDQTATSPVPIGYASVVDSKDNIISGTSKQATILQTKDGPQTTTPEVLPSFTAPTSATDASSTKIIHSHPIQVYTVDIGKDNKYEFSVMRDGEVLPNFNSPAYQIINIENTGMKGISAEKPSDVDISNKSINNKGYTLIIVGLLTPNKLADVNPTASSSPKKIQAGTSGATFYNNNFSTKSFQMTAEALRKMKKESDSQAAAAAKGAAASQTTNKPPGSN